MKKYRLFSFLGIFVAACLLAADGNAQSLRQDISLDNDWKTIAVDNDRHLDAGFYKTNIDDAAWVKVSVPHNWDGYDGYRRLLHGNFHGDAWYRKTFTVKQSKEQKRFFLFFEGVGSYAQVFVNGKKLGEHAGGRTTFTIDITDVIKIDGSKNLLAVWASQPSGITDLPWVCGGCSDERGFSEGSQPLGIFRPVHLLITNDIRVEPFGIHAWSDKEDGNTTLWINNTIKNYSAKDQAVIVSNQLIDDKGNIVTELFSGQQLVKAGESLDIILKNKYRIDPELWSPAHPYLYHIHTIVRVDEKIIDQATTEFGFRTISWKNPTHQFFINDQPVFINGIAEYEHLLGQSHAFSQEQVRSRMNWIKMAGFNAFRDAHQPHNLLYGHLCDSIGVLWWTQFSAHIWYDSAAFRNNFKKLLREWVIERRNDPSVILWGLQNESRLPEDFAKECTALIRELDPTASSQRLVTTCNGGTGTDWDVPQNWTGTYGGDPATYAADVKKQILIGEYGAWRTLDLHTEGGLVQDGPVSEDRMTALMEQKIRLAESVKDSSAGQFFWLLTSHDNPGRVQGGEGLRELDRVGPVNYKGLLTPWEEPTDAFYLFRSNYAPKEKEPMVYIVSHTWPGRWMTTGIKSGIVVYSNCDEVELFNDMDHLSLGKRKRNGIGSHFQWDHVAINYNILYAVGYVNGKIVAKDTIVLNHLPGAPHFDQLYKNAKNNTAPQPGYNYIYRINCGGPDYKDMNGNQWQADRALSESRSYNKNYGIDPVTPAITKTSKLWGSVSWTNDFEAMPAFFASQRRTFAPIKGTKDWPLFRDFRYGKDKLRYEFPLPDGEYLCEFYFIEPWLGTGGSMNAEGMRLFDIAVNDRTVLKDIDIWKEAGTNTLVKKSVHVKISGGKMVISFPQSRAGEAIISAIAIASTNKTIKPAGHESLVDNLVAKNSKLMTWADLGDRSYSNASFTFHALPANLYGADWIQLPKKEAGPLSFTVTKDADVFIAIAAATIPAWLKEYENTRTAIETDENGGAKFNVYRKRVLKNQPIRFMTTEGIASIMITPATAMQPAYDLKPVTSYRTNVAVISEGVSKDTVGGRECTVVRSAGKVTIQWPVQTGVADIYSVTIKYYYAGEDKLTGMARITGTGSSMMQGAPVTFTFTRPGKWNTVTFNTGSMINAGNYMMTLEIDQAEGLAISGIEIQ